MNNISYKTKWISLSFVTSETYQEKINQFKNAIRLYIHVRLCIGLGTFEENHLWLIGLTMY